MILNQQKGVRLARKPLERFLKRVQKELGVKDRAVTVCFVSDRVIAGLNERFRKKQGPTDVLSFPAGRKWRVPRGPSTSLRTSEWRAKKRIRTASAGDKAKQRPSKDSQREESYLGDIAIAPETARRYAKKNGRTLENELRVLILHGVLHLLGYDHETDRGEMDRFEQKLRRTFGLL
jgi:probable rRNA maturation factor